MLLNCPSASRLSLPPPVASRIADAGGLAVGLGALGVGEGAVGEGAGAQAVLVLRGAAGDGRSLQVGVAADADVEATSTRSDAALLVGAAEVVVDLLPARSGC